MAIDSFDNNENEFEYIGLDSFFNNETDKNIDWKAYFQLSDIEQQNKTDNN